MQSSTATKARASKPEATEYLPYYARYISLVAAGDVLQSLASQMRETQSVLRAIPASMSTHRYAPGKWSVNELVGHVIDSERIFAGRALRFARGDSTPVPGFEQDDYVANASFDAYPLRELAAELDVVRQSTLQLFLHLQEDAWLRRGTANGAEVSVRALAYIIAGHELHHRAILQEKYL